MNKFLTQSVSSKKEKIIPRVKLSLITNSSLPRSKTGKDPQSTALEHVELKRTALPKDYHCRCEYCKKFLGELIRTDGSNYSRLDRRAYYSKYELAATKTPGGHIAKTPLHVARWAVQSFTKKNDWVLDPTAGAGTTLVESITHGRNAVGIEIESSGIMQKNIEHILTLGFISPVPKYTIIPGDARNTDLLIDKLHMNKKFALVINNPPYWGDQSQIAMKGKGYEYNKERNNLAFLKESTEYYDTLFKVYSACKRHMMKGAHIVLAVKDQMRNKKPDELHRKLAELLTKIRDFEFIGTALLRHYPTTLFINTYEKHHGIKPPLYQSIVVFKKT